VLIGNGADCLSSDMTLEIEFPLEFIVEGTARSLGASSASKDVWKSQIRNAARARLPEGGWATGEIVNVTIYYFPDAEMDGDIDNIVKPILDAMSGPIFIDDRQVERLVVQKCEPHRLEDGLPAFSNPSVTLASAIQIAGPRVYLRVDLAEPWKAEE
jgi:crossover junction endodeoxyribonuclease RusA